MLIYYDILRYLTICARLPVEKLARVSIFWLPRGKGGGVSLNYLKQGKNIYTHYFWCDTCTIKILISSRFLILLNKLTDSASFTSSLALLRNSLFGLHVGRVKICLTISEII